MSRGEDCQKYVLDYQNGKEDAFAEIVKCVEPMIYKLIGPYKAFHDADDLYQTALIAVFECAKKYDHSRGILFTTYIFQAIKNELVYFVRKQSKHMTYHNREGKLLYTVTSFNKPYKNTDSGDDIEYIDLFVDESVDVEHEVLLLTCNDIVEQVIENWTPTRQAILRMYMTGVKQSDIANTFGMTRANISKIVKLFYEKCEEMLNENEE